MNYKTSYVRFMFCLYERLTSQEHDELANFEQYWVLAEIEISVQTSLDLRETHGTLWDHTRTVM